MQKTRKRHTESRTQSGLHIQQPLDDQSRLESEETQGNEQRIRALLDAAPDGVEHQIRVFVLERKPGQANPEEVYLYDIASDQLPTIWQTLSDTVGSGTYRIRVRRYDTDGKVFQIAQTTQTVRSLKPIVSAIAAVTPAPAGNDIALAIGTLFEKQQALFLQAIERLAPKQNNSDIVELMTALEALDKMRGRGETTAPVQDPGEIFRAGLEFAREIGAPGEKSWTDVLTTALESDYVGKVIEGFTTAMRAPTAATAAIGTPAALAAPATAEPAATPPGWQLALFEVLEDVAALADQKKDVADVADYVIENTPPSILTRLIGDDAMFQQLLAFPKVQPHRGFFVALREELKLYMAELQGEEPHEAEHDISEPAARHGGNGRDPQVDSPPDPARQAARPGAPVRVVAHRAPSAERPRRRNSGSL